MMNGWMGGMDGWMEGRMDSEIDGWTDDRMDRQIDRCINGSWIDVVIWCCRWIER